MQLHKLEFGQEMNCSRGKCSRICDGQKRSGHATLCFSCEIVSSFLVSSKRCLVQQGGLEGLLLGEEDFIATGDLSSS